MPYQTYDPRKNTFSFGPTGTGQSVVEAVEVMEMGAKYDEDAFTKTVSTDGRTVRTLNANQSGMLTLTLMAASPTNDMLSAIASSDRQSAQGIGPAQVKDGTGTAVASAPNAWIKKVPDLKRAKEMGTDVTWEFDCGDVLTLTQGGTAAV